MPSQKKIQFVSTLLETLQKTPDFVVIDFGKSTHKTLESLREKLRELTSEFGGTPFHVIKNSLFKVAAGKIKKPEIAAEAVLKGPSALLNLPQDWATVLGAFYSATKTDENFEIKVGILDGKIYFSNELVKIAQLPTRSQLVAQIIASLKTPQTRLVYSMKFNMTKLVYVLKSVKMSA